MDIEQRYEIKFLEIGTDKDHVYFLVQSVPRYSVTKLCNDYKELDSPRDFQALPTCKEEIMGRQFWTGGYFVSTVGRHGNEDTVKCYVHNQGLQDYEVLHCDEQLEIS